MPAFLLLLLAAAPAGAQTLPYEDMLGMPEQRLAYAEVPVAEESGAVHSFYGDRLEADFGPGGDTYSWDWSGEVGSERHRLWVALAGDGAFHGGIGYVEGQALYSHPILDAGLALQIGVRQDFVRPRRTYAVVGVQGNLTEPLYIGVFGFVSTKNELGFRAFAYYDWEPVPRVIVQPYVGAEAAAEDVPSLGIGRGPSELELGLRLRYRIAEPFAPYVGIRHDRLLGRTADIARQAGEDVAATSLVLGVRSYF
jgi:copper resistance protein B